ncbi:stage II sporulation protein M [Candidatus Poribacteria bacterium]
MNYDRFVRERQADWRELNGILNKIKSGGIKKLSRDELRRLGKLYRSATSHLAAVRTYFPSSEASRYLNQLVAQAHASIYRSQPPSLSNAIRMFRQEIPAVFQRRIGYIILAFALFAGAVIAGFVGCYFEEDLPRILVGDEYIDKTEGNIARGDPCAVYKTGVQPLASSIIMTNNIGVTFYAFSLGIFMGIGTTLILIFNGLIFGVVAFVFFQHNYGMEFLTTVMIHGTVELSCIFIAGGAGLLLGDALINPGHRFRKEALVQNGKEAAKLILGIAPWLVVAGIIEGFITPLDLSPLARVAIIVVTGTMFISYFFGLRRRFSP